jgi:tetratricopeptide (TPR) repeat protein
LKQIRPDYPIEAEAGNNFYQGGNYEKAYEYFSKTNKENLEEYYLTAYAVSAYMTNKKDESLQIAEYGAQKFNKNITFDRVALWSAVDNGKFDDAIKFANNILRTDSVEKSARDYLYYGMALKGNKQYDQAIEQYKKSYDMEKANFKPYQYIADAYTEMGQEDKALEYSEKYMQNNKDATPSDFAKLANIYTQKAEKDVANKQADLNKAYDIYEQMATKWPTIAAWVYNMAGMQASKAGQDDKGAEYFNKVIGLLENKADRDEDETNTLKSALANLGFYYWITKKDLESSKPIYEKLIKLDPTDKNARRALGLDEPTETTEGETK